MIDINFCPDKPEEEVSHLEVDIDDSVLEEIKKQAEERGINFETYFATLLKQAFIDLAETQELKDKIEQEMIIPG